MLISKGGRANSFGTFLNTMRKASSQQQDQSADPSIQILDLLKDGPVSIDVLMQKADFAAGSVARTLRDLEYTGLVRIETSDDGDDESKQVHLTKSGENVVKGGAHLAF